MEAYTDFASVYDTFMDETPYEEWASYLATLIQQYGITQTIREEEELGRKLTSEQEKALLAERNLVVDLGCGTGTLTQLLAKKGYDMIGIDNSQEMLNIAMRKKEQEGLEILYLCQDMQEMELYSTVGTVISVCDSVNYLLQEEELVQTFRQVNNYLFPGGVFIFDFNTLYKYQEIIGDTTIAENREDCSFIWENYFHEEEQINEYDLTIFVRESTDQFRKFTETHYQRGYTLEQMQKLLRLAGMEFVAAFDGDTHEETMPDSERIYVVAREKGK